MVPPGVFECHGLLVRVTVLSGELDGGLVLAESSLVLTVQSR